LPDDEVGIDDAVPAWLGKERLESDR